MDCNFKPSDKVLARNCDSQPWYVRFFDRTEKDGDTVYYCCDTGRYRQCIPFKGNEHLLGKNGKYIARLHPAIGHKYYYIYGRPGCFKVRFKIWDNDSLDRTFQQTKNVFTTREQVRQVADKLNDVFENPEI